jgi:ssDNA-binding Zn-finger/Zn-ribbon topoisomerase 1
MNPIFIVIAVIVGWVIIYHVIRWLGISLSNYIDNRAARSVLADFNYVKEKIEIKEIGPKYLLKAHRCPRCGRGMIILKKGRFGVFWACNLYPECNYTRSVKDELLLEKEKRAK